MPLRGHIEQYNNRCISGWAIDSTTDKPVILDIHANGILITQIRADKHRPDLEKVKSDGCCAFEFHIAPSLRKLLPIDCVLTVSTQEKILSFVPGDSVEKTPTTELSITGESENADALKASLEQGRIINKNGEVVMPISGRGPAWTDRAISDLCGLSTVFSELFGQPLCLAYGALLGLIRDGKLIGHDDDVDAIYISKESDPQRVAEEVQAMVKKLNEQGIEASTVGNGQMHVVGEYGVIIDVFSSWINKDRFNLYFTLYQSEVTTADIFPLQEVEFEGYPVNIPANPEAVLEAIYGSGWSKPDPHFQWRLPQTTVDFFKAFDNY